MLKWPLPKILPNTPDHRFCLRHSLQDPTLRRMNVFLRKRYQGLLPPPTQYPSPQAWPSFPTGPPVQGAPTTPQFSAPNTVNSAPQNAPPQFTLQTSNVQYQTNSRAMNGAPPNAMINYSGTPSQPFPSPSSGTFNLGSPNSQNGAPITSQHILSSPSQPYNAMSPKTYWSATNTSNGTQTYPTAALSQSSNQNSNMGPQQVTHYVQPHQNWQQHPTVAFNQAPNEPRAQGWPQTPSMSHGTQGTPIFHEGGNQHISWQSLCQPQSQVPKYVGVEARDRDRPSNEKPVDESTCRSPSQLQSLANSHQAETLRTEQDDEQVSPSRPGVLSNVFHNPGPTTSQYDCSSPEAQSHSSSDSAISSTNGSFFTIHVKPRAQV